MKTKLQLVLAIAGATLTTGCIVDPSYYPRPYYPPRAVEVAPAYYPPGEPAVEFVAPELVIMEGGVRHDRFFYERHPEVYWRDRDRYPDRFAHLPPPRRGEDPHKKKKDRDHHDDR